MPRLISIIVPAYNEERLLGETLRSIKTAMGGFHRHGWETELIVCDNNSKDRTTEIARAAGAQVVFEPVNQIGRARNTGAKAAKGEWLVFVDADSHPTAELFEDVAAAIETRRCIAGGVVLRMETESRLASVVVRLWNGLSRLFKLLAGSFVFCEARAFRELGGFDETLYAGEEIDLSQRLKKLGRKSGRKLLILSRHPLNTSARKVLLYTLSEHLTVIGKAMLGGRRALSDPGNCGTWYDGRR